MIRNRYNRISNPDSLSQLNGWQDTAIFQISDNIIKFLLYTVIYLFYVNLTIQLSQFEPPHDKTNEMSVCPAKTQISLGIRPVWSESSVSAWRKLVSLTTHWAHNEDFDQTGRIARLIWVFAGRTVILLVLSCGCSFDEYPRRKYLKLVLGLR